MRFRTISLKDPKTIRRIVHTIQGSAELRREAFREIARNAELQQVLFTLVAKGTSTAQTKFVRELAKNPRLRQKILKIAGQPPR